MRWLALLLVLVLAPVAGATTVWYQGAVISNPTTSQVLVTSPALARAEYKVSVYVYSDVGVPCLLQHLDASSVVQESIVIPGSVSFILFQAPYPLSVAVGDTIRVISRGNVTGEVQATLFVQVP